MIIKSTKLDRNIQIELGSLAEILHKKNIFHNEPLVFEKNENSDLVGIALPPVQEFFEKVFGAHGPYWDIYSQIGFAVRPTISPYVSFIQGKMYFLKNIENRFISHLGLETSFSMENGVLNEKKKFNITNIILALSYPFDAVKQLSRTTTLGFMINESIKKYEDFTYKTNDYYNYYSKDANIIDPLVVANESLSWAVNAMRYTNFALLSHSLKIKFRKSWAIDNDNLDELSVFVQNEDWEAVKHKFGFYSLLPYDITVPRFREDMKNLMKYGLPPFPREMALRWRESSKLLVSKYLDIERIALKKIGAVTGLGDLIFYFKLSELEKADLKSDKSLEALAIIGRGRRTEFEKWARKEIPPKIVLFDGKIFTPVFGTKEARSQFNIKGISVSVPKKVQGPAININSFDDFYKFSQGSIIISETLSPNLAILFRNAGGVVSETGGALSHAALIAREMKIPCIVRAEILPKIKDGQFIEVDGVTGKGRILEKGRINMNYSVKKSMDTGLSSDIRNRKITNIIFNRSKNIKKIIWLKNADEANIEIGVKAMNLSKIFRLYPVPAGFVLTVSKFNELLADRKLKDLTNDIKSANPFDIKKIDALSIEIRDIMEKADFGSSFTEELKFNFNKLRLGFKQPLFAIRSSSLAEDMENASFAGLFDTVLGVNDFDGLKKAVKKCWASFYNTRAVIYRIENGLNDADGGMAIIVQRMIKAKYSGVMFTKSIDDGMDILIEAVIGSGDGLVSGRAMPNSYRISRKDFNISNGRESFHLEHLFIDKLTKIGLNIENHFRRPQDIEWCIDNAGKIWILQTRPITSQRI